MSSVYILLENGKIFKGKGFGYELTENERVIGGAVFTTAMTGYIETLTDPGNFGLLVIQTFPLIGNYGIIPSDFESSLAFLSAYIVREFCETPSNFRSSYTLDTFLKNHHIPGVYDVDTRELTKIIREKGSMNAMIMSADPSTDTEGLIAALREYRPAPAIWEVSGKAIVPPESSKPAKYKIALMDFGVKASLIKELANRGCQVTVFPAGTKAEEIIDFKPDGVVFSNGPGVPSDYTEIVAEIKKIIEKKIPALGVCMGHLLLALAGGGAVEKLKYAHMGANQPVKDLRDGRIYMTSQGHSYAVKGDSLDPAAAEVSFSNLNDFSCEGINYRAFPAFSLQFHPEAAAGPLDTLFLFDRFIKLMEESQYAL